MDNFNNKKSKIDRLQEQLYDNDFKSKIDERSELEYEQHKIESDWQRSNNSEELVKSLTADLSEKEGLGFFGYILILAALFFVASIGYAGYVFWGGNHEISAEDVDISVSGPVSVGAGEVLSLDLIIQNNNPVQLEDVDLIVEYPNGSKSADDLKTDLKRTRERIDPIASGEILREPIKAVLFGEEGDNKEISVSIEYQVTGSNAIFSKKKVFSIILNAAPARISVLGLKEVSSGQEIEFEATVTSNSTSQLNNLTVTVNYPFGFKFIEADPSPSISDNLWVIESLPPKETKKIKIKGTLSGQNEEDRIFRFAVGLAKEENNQEIGVVFSNFIHEMTIQRPFVGLKLLIDNSDESVVAVKSGNKVSSKLIFSNNTNDYIRNLDIRLDFDGSVFDESSFVVNDGYYRSVDNTLIFNRDTSKKFIEIKPRQSSEFDINFLILKLLNLTPNIINPEIKINAYLEADRVSETNVEDELKDTISKTIRVISDVFVATYTLSDMGPFANSGQIPPRAEQPTTYTLQWSISNSYNNLTNAKMTGILPAYVSWNNRVSPSSEVYTYDEKTRQITWNIGNVAAGAGQRFEPKELYFQVTLVPSLTQVGQKPILLNDIFFSAQDDFTKTNIEIRGNSPTTYLSDDNTVQGHEIVIE